MTILMCAQKLTDASLMYRTGPKTKTSKMKKTKKQMDMLRRNGAGQETMEFNVRLLCYDVSSHRENVLWIKTVKAKCFSFCFNFLTFRVSKVANGLIKL